MLEELNINNLGIVDNTSLPFTKGLNVITGETGAGKSMILNGLGLLLGKRAKTSLISEGSDQLTVEGCWSFDTVPAFVEESNATVEDGQLFVSRSVKKDGKSRATVGGRAIPASVLTEISSQLVSLHGQSDQLKLKSNATQLLIVDKFGGEPIAELLKEYKAKYKDWLALKKALEDYRENSALKAKEREFYQEVVDMFEQVNPKEGEDETLENLIRKLSNVETVRESMAEADYILSNDEDVPDLTTLAYSLTKAINSASKMDDELVRLAEQAERVNSEIVDLAHEVSSYLHSVDYESIASLNEAQERLSVISNLNRKYGQPDLAGSLEFWRKAENWLSTDLSGNTVEELEERYETMTKELYAKGVELSNERQKAADKLATEMNIALRDLSMGSSVFTIEIYETALTATGNDIVEFMLKAHKKAEPYPVNTTASGGELSRIMLALETVTANTDETTTFVFDEIDSGVGGETAVQIGKRLATLAKHAQVIVVTHLPQVAGFADNHLLIQKSSEEDKVSTTVKQLDETARRAEIARMLSGLDNSSTGLAHADELLSFAHTWKTESVT